MAANPCADLFLATRSAIFSGRNVDKTAKGDFVRGAVAAGQARNAIGAVATSNGVIGKAASAGVKSFDSLAKAHTALGYTAKAVNIASKYINPLLCLSGGVKVLKADDKKSEAIKQTLALGTMFSFEKTAKAFMTPSGRTFLSKFGISSQKGLFKHVMRAFEALDKLAGTNRWTKILIPMAKGLTYVGLSMTGYSLGSKISDKINEYRQQHPLINRPNYAQMAVGQNVDYKA